MPDLLVLCADSPSYFKLEELGKAKGFRVKATSDSKIAMEWLRLRNFDVAFVDFNVDPLLQQDAASLLWKRNPLAGMAVFDLLNTHPEAGPQIALLGAEGAFGKDAIASLERLLEVASSRARTKVAVDMKILVVEDLDSPRDIICFYLESLGVSNVVGVRSASEAIKALEEKSPQTDICVLTDIRMPGMDGRQLIEFIRHHKKLQQIPIIALTAYGTVDTLVDCLKAGASGFLVKPPKRDDLIREISRAMRILANKQSPRLASEHEAEALRDILVQKGFS